VPAGCGEGIVEVGSNSDEVIESQRGRGAGRCFHVGHVRAEHFVADGSVRRGSAAREMESGCCCSCATVHALAVSLNAGCTRPRQLADIVALPLAIAHLFTLNNHDDCLQCYMSHILTRPVRSTLTPTVTGQKDCEDHQSRDRVSLTCSKR